MLGWRPRDGLFPSDKNSNTLFAINLGVSLRELVERSGDSDGDDLTLPLLTVLDQAQHNIAQVCFNVDSGHFLQ